MADVNKKKRELSPELLEKARVELNEIQSEVPGHIEALRQRILQDPTINFRTDDSFLLRFLRARKFEQDKAYELMIDYYKQRDNYPSFFSKTKPELEKITDSQVIGVLPNRDTEGRAMILALTELWNTSQVSFEQLAFQFMVMQELLLEDEAVQINGVVWIFEMSGYNLKHVTQMTPWKIKQATTVLINAFPVRMKQIHFVNEPRIFDGVYLIIKRFLSKEIQDIVVFHGKRLESLHKLVSPDVLPKELGGDLDPVDFNPCNKLLLQNFDRISEDFKNGYAQPK